MLKLVLMFSDQTHDSPDIAERLMLSGKVLTADEMYDLKLIDVVAEDGEEEQAVREFISEHSKRQNAHAAMHQPNNLR